MSGVVDNWPALSFLEGLRPGPDEQVELALLAFYSADLGSIGATLLALAGKDSDAGKGSPSDFADAVERLRRKVRIVIQRGRLAKMPRTPRIAAVLDQFVREVDFDEAQHSWHPKSALIRTKSEGGAVHWRLWIGSSNLTECVNRDIGLLLVSGTKSDGTISGAGELARGLAERANLKGVRPASLAAEVSKVSWCAPVGVRVSQIRWSSGKAALDVPTVPSRVDNIVVVSPFVDKTFLAGLVSNVSKKAECVLLTTMRQIEQIGPPLLSFKFKELLALDAPDYPIDNPEPKHADPDLESGADSANDEEEEIGRGLHAKMLFVRAGRKRTLWLGSANATMRAWTGRNAEVTAELQVTEAVEKGLLAMLSSARIVEVPNSEVPKDDLELEEEALEQARTQVAARWAGSLGIDGDKIVLIHDMDLQPDGPHPDEPGILLEVGSLIGTLKVWPRRQETVVLEETPRAEQSEFVRLRVSRGDKGLSWLQRAPVDPPFGEDRDRAAFARLLGARGFLVWVAGLLADDGRDGGADWTIEKKPDRVASHASRDFDPSLPTLEEMLAAWARDKDRFHEIERRVSDYLPAVLEQVDEKDPQADLILRRFASLWRTLRIGLGEKSKGKRR
nr:phospholipase D family protein [uncultured Cohaesibacter sp.]